MRKLVLLLALGLAGCAHSVTLKSPVSGETVTCRAGLIPDMNPWSKYQLCLESYVSEGYQRVN